MLACGADITQINTIRKRLSGVKGGRFAQLCAPAYVYAILLSDVIGDPPDMIASGPAYPASTTTAKAMALVSRYGLTLSPQAVSYTHLIEQGVVVTKYGHSQGPIGDLAIYEAGHPVPDEHSVRATEAALAAVSGLRCV